MDVCMSMTLRMAVHNWLPKARLPIVPTQNTDMIERGFEYAFMHGEPRNANSKRYRMMPMCCQLRRERYDMTSCAHDWPVKFELPMGDPLTGRAEWTRGGRPDTGTYEGGTLELL